MAKTTKIKVTTIKKIEDLFASTAKKKHDILSIDTIMELFEKAPTKAQAKSIVKFCSQYKVSLISLIEQTNILLGDCKVSVDTVDAKHLMNLDTIKEIEEDDVISSSDEYCFLDNETSNQVCQLSSY